MDYEAFLRTKSRRAQQSGLRRAVALSPQLFDYQRDTTEFLLKAGSGAAFLDTGMGKSFIELEWARVVRETTNKPVLMLAPLAVGPQHVREAARFGIDDVRVVKNQDDIKPGINVANYERLHLFDPSVFGGIVLDECFAADTEIDCIDGKKRIQDIRAGDHIINAAGVDIVSDTHRREVPYAVKVSCNQTAFIASPNHPVFTQRGWVGAQDLRPGDYALETGSAMSMVRNTNHTSERIKLESKILRDILLSEMADESSGTQGKSPYAGNFCQDAREKHGMAAIGLTVSDARTGENPRAQSDNKPGHPRQDFSHIESDAARSFRAWGEWPWANGSAGIHDGCAWRRLDSGVCFVTGPTDSRLSNTLQAGLSASREKNSHRSGWSVASQPEGIGFQERRNAGFVRVDSIEVLESGNPELERLRDADGKLYFYDLGATRHPSYSVNGLLVHNSSIIKNYTGKTTRALMEFSEAIAFRLCATATPAPNDHMELGQHSQFLGVMDSSEMLARWFISDQSEMGRYRLKRHGVKPFWSWVASWARCLTKPSDLGYSDDGFVLPPLNVIRHSVDADITANTEGQLFRQVDVSATAIHKEKRLTSGSRAERVAEIIGAHPNDACVIWVETDYDADAVMARIPEAVEVRGSMSLDMKESRLNDFSLGNLRVLVTKPRVAGFGLNFQHCALTVFAGLSFSYEQFYQATRRFWRYGQQRTVDCHVVMAETEEMIWKIIQRKAADHEAMKAEMAEAMKRETITRGVKQIYSATQTARLPSWIK